MASEGSHSDILSENTYCDRCVASDVEVVESEAGETERQRRGKGRGKSVRVAPVHVLIPRPVHQGVTGRAYRRETQWEWWGEVWRVALPSTRSIDGSGGGGRKGRVSTSWAKISSFSCSVYKDWSDNKFVLPLGFGFILWEILERSTRFRAFSWRRKII